MPCPNCGASASKSLELTVDVQLPDNPSKRLRVLRCPACTCHFYDSQVPPDYAEPALNNRGRVPFYVQQGAGVSLITRPLAQAASPEGSAYMEVGCGFGFGLDFALNTRGWNGVGIDPAPLAALGCNALHLPIELRYLRDDDEAGGTRDVVMGSEVIEHVTSPVAFVGRPLGDPSAARKSFSKVRASAPSGTGLWWAALRGEMQAIDQEGVSPKAASFIAGIVSANLSIEMGFPEMARLVNFGHHDVARGVIRRSRLDSAKFARPGTTAPLSESERNYLFFLAILDAQIGPDGRAVGKPARGRSRFARVRTTTSPGSDLWWAALRGELQSLELLDAQAEAAALTTEIQTLHPNLALPDDIAVRIATSDTEGGRL